MADAAELARIIEPEVEAEGLALVRVMMIGGKDDLTLQVMAERAETRQLTIEDCARLSRRISERLDAEDPIEESYRLEVSSPGIDRPLTRLKDYDDWKGHEAKVTLAEKLEGRRQYHGTLLGSEGETVLIDVRGVGPTGLPFSDIHSAKLVLTDKLIAATAPLSAEGAQQIELEPEESLPGAGLGPAAPTEDLDPGLRRGTK